MKILELKLLKFNKIDEMYPKHFFNSKEWTDFFLEVNDTEHDIFSLSSVDKNLEFKLYQYPWILGQKSFYAGVFPEVKSWSKIKIKNQLKQDLLDLFQQINLLAKKKKVVFLKFNLDHQFIKKLDLNENDLKSVAKYLNLTNLNPSSKLYFPVKKLQYEATITLDLKKINNKNAISRDSFELSELQEYYFQNNEFFRQTNQNIRRYTKKSLQKNWTVDCAKSDKNLKHFLEIYTQTTTRQNFFPHPQKYYKILLKKEFSRIIILKDAKGEPHCVWLGIILDGTITYLYGGNTNFSFQNYGQYATHLVALNLASANQEKVNFYDLGGHDPKFGFSKFKEGYRGELRQFAGTFDWVFQPLKYQTVNFVKKVLKKS